MAELKKPKKARQTSPAQADRNPTSPFDNPPQFEEIGMGQLPMPGLRGLPKIDAGISRMAKNTMGEKLFAPAGKALKGMGSALDEWPTANPASTGGALQASLAELMQQIRGGGGAQMGFLGNMLGMGPKDIELPNETGQRDPRLGPGSAWDQLKLSRDVLKKLAK